MKKSWLIGGGIVVLAAVLGGGLFTGLVPGGSALAKSVFSAKKDEKKDPRLEFTAREVVHPQRMRLTERLEFSGPLVAPSTAVLRAKAPGTLLSLDVAEGSRVRAGQVLGRIDLAEQASRLAERSASVESARATLVQAERTHASNERLAAQQFISPIALENSRAAVDTAHAMLQAAQAAADTARIGLRDGTLVAPIAGIVAKRHVLPGEKVAIEQQVLTVVDLARLELAGVVGTHEVSRLAPGMATAVRVEGMAQPVQGRIARIAPAAEPGTRSIAVTIELANPQELLRAGQYAVASVELADDTERLTLPLSAVTGRAELMDAVQPGGLGGTYGGNPIACSQVLAARFDNLREGAQAAVVAAKAPAVASASASTPLVK